MSSPQFVQRPAIAPRVAVESVHCDSVFDSPQCSSFSPAPRRIILLAGPTASGTQKLSARSGLPTVPLDHFYLDPDHPGLPRRDGVVDWEDPRSWDADAALVALTSLAYRGEAEIPSSSTPRSQREERHTREVGDAPVILAEGVFAAELIAPLTAAGLLAGALVLHRPAPLALFLRLARGIREARTPVSRLIRHGSFRPQRDRDDLPRRHDAGLRPCGRRQAARLISQLSTLTASERHAHPRSDTAGVRRLRITAVCFLRQGVSGWELLGVRKNGTGTFMQVGGKLEQGESPQQAAVREVAEETGLTITTEHLEPLGTWTMPAANEPGTVVDATVFICHAPVPEGFQVQAELAESRWFPLDASAPLSAVRIAPLMEMRIMPALRERLVERSL